MYLNSHSYFSFRYGILSPKELLEEAAKHGVHAMALTDINYTGSCQDFVRLAPSYGIRPIVGVDIRNKNNQQVCVAIAKNNLGFKEINDYLSFHLHEKAAFDSFWKETQNVYIIYPYSQYTGFSLGENEWIGIHKNDLNRVGYGRHQIPEEKTVILHTVTFRRKRDYNAHRLLRAIDKNTLLSKLATNEQGRVEDTFLSSEEFHAVYGRFEYALRNTNKLLEECGVDFLFKEDGHHKNQKHYHTSTKEDYEKVIQLCQEGLRYRYSTMDTKIRNRLNKELITIRDQGFLSYFLINWRIAQYARSKGYFYVGRGSGANSIVAYLLRITDVDPIELDLYFERFINLYRKNPPDFDVDFSWRDREDITQFIFDEFDNVALLGTYNTFQHKAVIRQLGKVFGLPTRDIEDLQVRELDLGTVDSMSRLVLQYGELIHKMPSHLGIHAGGILISQDPIHMHTATELPPKGFPTVQFDMVTAEDIGLNKYDILSQRGLGKIKDTLDIIRYNKPKEKPIDIHDVRSFIADQKVKEILSQGQAIGCFYVESPAMRMLLIKLRVKTYLGLVAASSVIRPGVAKSGMMREYILRFRYPSKRKDAHPILQQLMPETYGIMVYQEDVIKVAHHFAGLSLGESDVLRRGMSGKFRSRDEFKQVQDKFFSNCSTRGYDPKVTKEIWMQIESFAGYAFAKGHSASYAVESYQTLYLKAYYPLEYAVAILNNGGGFYSRELYIHEARMQGARIEAPCINTSYAETIINGSVIYLGFSFLKELGEKTIAMVLGVRNKRGLFLDLNDCISRSGISLEQVKLLIRVGAFRCINENKKSLLWEAHFLLGNKKKSNNQAKLFDSKPRNIELPKLAHNAQENAFDEMELLGFPLSDPFLLVKNAIPNHMWAADFPKYIHKTIQTYGYLIAIKRTKTSHGDRMYFGTFIDRSGAFIDTVHFPPVARQYPFRGKGVYRLIAKVVDEFDFCSLEVISMYKEVYITDPRYQERAIENAVGNRV